MVFLLLMLLEKHQNEAHRIKSLPCHRSFFYFTNSHVMNIFNSFVEGVSPGCLIIFDAVLSKQLLPIDVIYVITTDTAAQFHLSYLCSGLSTDSPDAQKDCVHCTPSMCLSNQELPVHGQNSVYC